MIDIITVYENTESDFTHNGLGVLLPTLCDITEELNGIYELEIYHSLDSRGRWKNLVEDNIIKADGQLFRIYNKNTVMNGIRVKARHVYYDLLDDFLEDVRPENLNGAAALDWILTRTQYPHNFTSMSDISTTNTAYFVRKNPVEAIMDKDGIISRWGGELVRDNFTIKLLSQRGQDRGVHIRYKKNLTGLEQDLDLDSVITRVMPLGADALMLPEKYIDSPLINNYANPKVRKVEFNDIKIDEENGITQEIAIQQLRETATKWMIDTLCDIPFVNYKVNFIELSKTEEYKNYAVLERVYLGDTVTIKHEKLGFDLKAKCIKYKKDVLRDRYVEIELGNFKDNISSSINKTINQVVEIIETNKTDLQKAVENATNLLTTALGGFVIKREGEMLIMDTEDPATAEKVWRWNLNGLGYSSTGVNGPYDTAITMDGHIVAQYITGLMITAAQVRAGILTSEDGETWINLDDGTFNFKDHLSFDGTNFSLKLNNNEDVEDSLNNITQNFNFTDDGFTIGKTVSPLSITVSNSQMSFIDNGKVAAYVNGQKMYINALEVLSSLVVGVHKIEKYNNDITLIKWVGGS